MHHEFYACQKSNTNSISFSFSGVGLGLIYLPAIVSVTYYFEKRRSFATGLAVCGSGVGTFVFAPLTKMLVEQYSWKGAVLILAGLLLNCILCGALFRPLEMKQTTFDAPVPEPCDPSEQKEKVGNGAVNGGVVKALKDADTHSEVGVVPNGKGPSAVPLLAIKSANGKSAFHSMQAIDDAVNKADPPLRSYASDHLLHRVKHPEKPAHDLHKTISPMSRKDIFYGHSLQNIPIYRSNPALYTRSILSIPREIDDQEDSKKCQICSDDLKDSFKEMMDLSLMKNPLFVMFVISNFLTSIGFCIPYMFLPDWAIIQGIDPQKAPFLISVIGMANTVGRVVFGFLSDRPCVNRLYLYNVALTICGVFTSLSPFCYSYELLCAYAAVFGMFLGE